MTLRALANHALARVFAPPCAACGHTVPRPLDGAVCDTCWAAVLPFTPPLCSGCGDPLVSWRLSTRPEAKCPRCRRRARPIARQAAVGPYEGTLRHAVHALKYGGRLSVAPRLSNLLAAAGAPLLLDAHLVVPVPLHPRREWARGFNQAELLARGLGLPVHSLLSRVRATPAQVDLPAAQRHRNVREAFALNARAARRLRAEADAPLAGLVVVLVDDVATTGATLDACARVLRESGAAEVRALTVARVVTGPR